MFPLSPCRNSHLPPPSGTDAKQAKCKSSMSIVSVEQKTTPGGVSLGSLVGWLFRAWARLGWRFSIWKLGMSGVDIHNQHEGRNNEEGMWGEKGTSEFEILARICALHSFRINVEKLIYSKRCLKNKANEFSEETNQNHIWEFGGFSWPLACHSSLMQKEQNHCNHWHQNLPASCKQNQFLYLKPNIWWVPTEQGFSKAA